MTTHTEHDRPSWEGIPERVPLHDGVSVGTWLVGILLTVASVGLFVPFFAWDYLRRANAVGRDGIHTYIGLLRWTELEEAVVHNAHTTRRGRITATVHMVQLRFRDRTLDVGPWGAPDPRLVLRALSAGVGRTLEVPRPSGNVRWTRDR
jgi:hypothetical protein